MDKKHQKCPKKGGFPPFKIFFQNRALSLLYPYGALTSCKKLEKSLEGSLRYLKTDQGTTDGHGWLHRTLLGKPGVQKIGQKYAKNTYFVSSPLNQKSSIPPETEIINMVPDCYAETSLMIIYLTDMRACILSYVRVAGDLQGPKCGEKYANYANFGSLNLEYSIWSLNIVQNIFNDYLWSYMIETDISACVLTCYRIFDNLQDKKLIKNMPKIQVLPSLESWISNLVP